MPTSDRIPSDTFAEPLTHGFLAAVWETVREAYAAGLVVPGRENDRPVEYRPDGMDVEIDDSFIRPPSGWRDPP